MKAGTIEDAAKAFAQMRQSKSAAERLADNLAPATVSEGYDVQNALCALLEAEKGPAIGHKIGCTTPVMQEFLGIDHPCAGRLYANEVVSDAVTLRLIDFVGVGVECEIALRLGRTLKPGDTPFSQASVADAVEVAMAAVEIVDNRYADFHDFGTPSLIADDFFSAGAVLGPPVPITDMDLSMAHGVMQIDGTEIGEGRGSAVMGNPLQALAWLANQKAERDEVLKAGDVIMTGSIVATQWITKPCTVLSRVTPLGEVRVTFV